MTSCCITLAHTFAPVMCADEIYGGSLREVIVRCALLSKAALEAACHVPCGGSPSGDANLLFIANDWHTALVPVYLQVSARTLGCLVPWVPGYLTGALFGSGAALVAAELWGCLVVRAHCSLLCPCPPHHSGALPRP